MLRDQSAREHVMYILEQHKSGKLEEQGRTTWVMAATQDKPLCLRKFAWDGVGDPAVDKIRVVSTPTFAFDWEHQHFWDEAIAMLKHNGMPPPINLVKKRVQHWYQDEPRPQVSKEREIEYTTDLFNAWDRQDPAWLYAERLYS